MNTEIEVRLGQMEEAFSVTQENHKKAMENLQQEVEANSKAKAEVMRMRPKLEQSILELDSGLDQSQLKFEELQGQAKKTQDNIKKMGDKLEAELEAKEAAMTDLLSSERKLSGAK